MLPLIIVIVSILFLVLIAWTWHSLGDIENTKKISYIIIGIVIDWVITFIIYNISKIGIQYDNQEVMKVTQTVFVLLFTIVNGYLILPYTFKILDEINNNLIETKTVQKKFIIILVIFIIISIIECKYFSNIQLGILDLIKK